jgi:RNA polymerase sigma factor (sigma-70 family)
LTTSPQDATDAALIAASTEHAERFGALFDRHGARLFRYAARRVGVGLAEDVVAHTFLNAFRFRSGYDPSRDDAWPWLVGICTREISHRRREESARYRLLSRLPAPAPVTDHADAVTDQVAAEEGRAYLVRELARLRPGDRDVLLAYAWADLTYPQIAEALAIPVGNVRSRMNRARRVLRVPLAHLDPSRTNGDPR